MKTTTVIASLSVLTALLVSGCAPGDMSTKEMTTPNATEKHINDKDRASEKRGEREVLTKEHQRKVRKLVNDFEGITHHYYSQEYPEQSIIMNSILGQEATWKGMFVRGEDGLYFYRTDMSPEELTIPTDDIAYSFVIFLNEEIPLEMPQIQEGDIVTVRGQIEGEVGVVRGITWILGHPEIVSIKPGKPTEGFHKLLEEKPAQPLPGLPISPPTSSAEGDAPYGFPPNGEELTAEEQEIYEDILLRYAWQSITPQEQAGLCEAVSTMGMEDTVEVLYFSMQGEVGRAAVTRMLERECLTIV